MKEKEAQPGTNPHCFHLEREREAGNLREALNPL